MTEEDWLSLADPQPMLAFLRHKGNARKLRLFALACCDRFRDYLGFSSLREVLELTAGPLEGDVTWRTLEHAWRDVAEELRKDTQTDRAFVFAVYFTAFTEHRPSGPQLRAVHDPAMNVEVAVEHVSRHLIEAAQGDERLRNSYSLRAAERQAQSDLLREIFGNPFREMIVDPRWLTASVEGMLRVIYAQRAFDRMPILGDALLEAGCDQEEMIAHCHHRGPHCRGCWLVDLLLKMT